MLTRGGSSLITTAAAPRSAERAPVMSGLIASLQSGVGCITQKPPSTGIAGFGFGLPRRKLSCGKAAAELSGKRRHIGLLHDCAMPAVDLEQFDLRCRLPPNGCRIAGPEPLTGGVEKRELPVVRLRSEGDEGARPDRVHLPVARRHRAAEIIEIDKIAPQSEAQQQAVGELE